MGNAEGRAGFLDRPYSDYEVETMSASDERERAATHVRVLLHLSDILREHGYEKAWLEHVPAAQSYGRTAL